MGIITNVKGYLKTKTEETIDKANNAVNKASQFSSEQLAEIEDKRKNYLSEMPEAEDQSIIEKNLGAIGIEIYQDYVNKLGAIYEPCDMIPPNFNADARIMYFEIAKWVTDSEEKNLDKLVNVYHVLSEEDCNIALIYNRKQNGCTVTVGVINTDDKQSESSLVQGLYKRVVEAIKGNFPGVELRQNTDGLDSFGVGVPDVLNDLNASSVNGLHSSVAVVTNLPSEKSENFISQSMEKLLDGIIPDSEEEEYTIVLLAKPIREQLERQNRLYELYSALAPYSNWSTNFTYTESMAENAGANLGVNVGASAGIQYSLADTTGKSVPEKFKEDEVRKLQEDGKKHRGRMTWNQLKGAGSRLLGWYVPTTNNTSQTTTNGVNAGVNFGVSFSRSSSVTAQLGKNEGLTQNYTNYGVKHTLEIIENQVKRIEQSSALGMWDFAAYVISKDPVIANNVAHMYVALTQGEESFVSRSSISLWDGSHADTSQAPDTIIKSVSLLQHPIFRLKANVEKDWLMYPTLVTATTTLSGLELAKALNFPRKSVTKFPVLESVSFARDVQTFNDLYEQDDVQTISIGSVYHMRRVEQANKIKLNVNSLTSHVFVTGSTGTGKSNTVYQLLDKLYEQNIKFLVVEPAKGEYKEIFGGYSSVKVYGTNPKLTNLLQINPFSFPDSIHVLEHIDRLVEILNACWPMYAAMPAVLKDAIERIYVNVGWNLQSSRSRTQIFPTFSDLLDELPRVMDSSMYSDETKSDYSGALVTRVNSLTNGINKQIFCSGNELTCKDLFENNVIVDLSRLGSAETKSLIMGIMIMKLQEYRMDLHEMNSPLKHITVLEEAHNILRKTSIDQSQEGANVQGKSVEMISNAIAEMRTYGEGFIIADQAPCLLDESVIRNTNTKIVLRLPDSGDRRAVGESISLSEEQMNELAKLPKGVAAVYQNDWLESVLCAFDKFDDDKKKPLVYEYKNESNLVEKFVARVFGDDKEKLDSQESDSIIRWIEAQLISKDTKDLAIKALGESDISQENKEILAYNIFNGAKVATILAENVAHSEVGEKKVLEYIATANDLSIENANIKILYQMIVNVISRVNEDSEIARVYKNIETGRGHIV